MPKDEIRNTCFLITTKENFLSKDSIKQFTITCLIYVACFENFIIQ